MSDLGLHPLIEKYETKKKQTKKSVSKTER